MQRSKRIRRRALRIAALCAVVAIVGAVVVLVPALVEYVSFSDQFTCVGKNEFGLREYRHAASGIVLVLIPGGTFLMGSPEDEPGRRDDECRHVVSLSSFMIGRHEVTQGEWIANGGAWHPRREIDELSPAYGVSWNDARRFVDALGLHLPTEAQWEYACRAGTTGRFHRELDSVGWYASNQGPDLLSDVAMKRPNGFGLYDMHGNAFEWCEDKYDEHFYRTSHGARDPISIHSVENRNVFRGGCAGCEAVDCRSAARHAALPEVGHPLLGFRVAYRNVPRILKWLYAPDPPPAQPTPVRPAPTPLYVVEDIERVPEVRCSLVVRLSRKVSEERLRRIAVGLRTRESGSYPRFLISYYLPNTSIESGAWATSHFEPTLNVRILGELSPAEERLLASEEAATGEVVGEWLGDGTRMTIYEEAGRLFLDEVVGSGSAGRTPLAEADSPRGRKFEITLSHEGDHFVLLPSGDLEIRNRDGLIRVATPAPRG